MRFISAIFLVIGAGALVRAQQVGVTGPIEAFAFDAPTESFRAIIGVPGAATFGPPIVERIDFGSVAPHQNFAIAFQSGKCLVVSSLDSVAVFTPVTSGAPTQPEGVAWSADGSSATLYSRSGNWIQTVAGLPNSPAAGTRLDLSSLPGTLSAVASDSQGKQIAIAMSGASGGVYLISSSQSFVPVIPLSHVVALSFSGDATDLYSLDSAVPQLSAVNLSTLSSQDLPLDGLANPLAMQTGQDAQANPVVYVASGSDQLLRVIDLASQPVTTDVPLNTAPNELDTLGLNSFVIATRAQLTQPLWLFTSSPQAASYFVPAVGLEKKTERPWNVIAGGLR